MNEDVERYVNMQESPGVYVFKDETLTELAEALTKSAQGKEPRLVIRLGRRVDGSPCMWLDVKAGGESVAQIDNSFNCPPLPPSECE